MGVATTESFVAGLVNVRLRRGGLVGVLPQERRKEWKGGNSVPMGGQDWLVLKTGGRYNFDGPVSMGRYVNIECKKSYWRIVCPATGI